MVLLFSVLPDFTGDSSLQHLITCSSKQSFMISDCCLSNKQVKGTLKVIGALSYFLAISSQWIINHTDFCTVTMIILKKIDQFDNEKTPITQTICDLDICHFI